VTWANDVVVSANARIAVIVGAAGRGRGSKGGDSCFGGCNALKATGGGGGQLIPSVAGCTTNCNYNNGRIGGVGGACTGALGTLSYSTATSGCSAGGNGGFQSFATGSGDLAGGGGGAGGYSTSGECLQRFLVYGSS
jgi:hypothetical protein